MKQARRGSELSALPKFQKVGRHSWGAIGAGDDVFHSYGSNQGLVFGRRTVLVFDTGFHVRVSMELLKRARRSRTNTIFVTNSHHHTDHTFGNCTFADAGSLIVAHENCGRNMQRKSASLLEGYRRRDSRLSGLLRGVRVAFPDITYRDRLESMLGDQLEAMIIHPGLRAHTNGDSLVFVPRDRAVFAGDLLWVGYHPNMEDADFDGQVTALRMILRLRPRRIVPGHGPVCGVVEVRRFIKYLQELDRNIRSGLRKSLRDDELVHRAIPRWSRDWKMRWLMESYIRDLAGKS